MESAAFTRSSGGLRLLPLKRKTSFWFKISWSKTPKYSRRRHALLAPKRIQLFNLPNTLQLSLQLRRNRRKLLDIHAHGMIPNRPFQHPAAIEDLPKVVFLAIRQLLAKSSETRYCSFLSSTFPCDCPLTLARKRPFGVRKHKWTPPFAHAPISAGLAPRYENETTFSKI